MNPWSVLGLDKSATPDEIKKAYRRLASINHPDKGGDTKKFQEIQQAYDQLTNPNSQHNNPQQAHPFGNNPFRGGPFGGFEEFFRGGFGFPGGQQRPQGNADITAEMAFPLRDFLTGNTYDINVNVSGVNQAIHVELKPEYKPGTRMKFTGKGNTDNPNAPPGDLYIIIRQHHENNWERQNDNLITTLTVDAVEAIVGCSRKITLLDNTEIEIGVPAGSQPNTVLRVRGRGMLQGRNAGHGDLMVRLSISIPVVNDADLNKSIKELYNERYNRNN